MRPVMATILKAKVPNLITLPYQMTGDLNWMLTARINID